jgi:hypothetical protein
MKKREMIKEIQRYELVLRRDMFIADETLGEADMISVSRLRIWVSHTTLMDNLRVDMIQPRLKDTNELQQLINKLTFSETFLGKR